MIDFDKVRAEQEARDQRFKDGMQRINDEIEARNAKMAAILEKSVKKNEDAKAAMMEELAAVDQEAEQRKKNIRNRYASVYGAADWNTDKDEYYREFARNLGK